MLKDDLLQTADAAAVAGVTPAAIHRAVQEGRLHVAGRTVRGTRLYLRCDVEQYARSRGKRSGRKPIGEQVE